jgi:chemotaxis protein MotB
MAADKGAKKVVIVRKKKVAGGGHHGGSWKVAYADFVTAMMAFFMVMWILGMDDKTKQAIEGYFSSPVGYKKGAGAGSSPISSGSAPTRMTAAQIKSIVRAAETQRFNQLAGELRTKLAANNALKELGAKIEVVVTREGLRIELVESGQGDVFFPLGSAQMKPAALIALQTIAPSIAGLPNPVVLEGHTDAARYTTGTAYTNWELSGERANAARRVLEISGLPPGRVAEVRGYADRHPRNADDALDPSNRRISVLLPYASDARVDEVSPGAEGPAGMPVGLPAAAGAARTTRGSDAARPGGERPVLDLSEG